MVSIDKVAAEQLRLILSSTALVLTPSMDGFQDSIKRWASSAEKQAGLVVFPRSTSDLVNIVQFSVNNGIELAIGGGMHSFFSSTEGGISIDLSKMNGVFVDPEAMTITVQGGALWSDVDDAAAQHGLAAVGGTVNSVGVAGLTLGGGYGYLSAAHGLAIDNLLSAEIVLANGQVVIASDNENQDLFWAIRGAGTSFGVATKLVLRAHDQKDLVWGGTLVFNKHQLSEVIEFANRTMEVADGQATMVVGFSKPDVTLQPSVIAVVFYNGTEEAAKSFYAPLLALNPVSNHTAMVPYPAVNAWHNSSFVEGSRRAMKGSALLTPVSASFVGDLFEDYSTLIEEIPDAAKSVVLFDFFNFKKILSVPQTATSFANRGAFVNVLFAPAWNNKHFDSICQKWTLCMAAKTRTEMDCQRSLGVDETTMMATGEYKNYDSFGSTDSKNIFGVNYERLVALKKFYDPQNVFAKGHNLLSAANAFNMQAKTPLASVLTHGSFIRTTVATTA